MFWHNGGMTSARFTDAGLPCRRGFGGTGRVPPAGGAGAARPAKDCERYSCFHSQGCRAARLAGAGRRAPQRTASDTAASTAKGAGRRASQVQGGAPRKGLRAITLLFLFFSSQKRADWRDLFDSTNPLNPLLRFPDSYSIRQKHSASSAARYRVLLPYTRLLPADCSTLDAPRPRR
jgi:hypothetical protein